MTTDSSPLLTGSPCYRKDRKKLPEDLNSTKHRICTISFSWTPVMAELGKFNGLPSQTTEELCQFYNRPTQQTFLRRIWFFDTEDIHFPKRVSLPSQGSIQHIPTFPNTFTYLAWQVTSHHSWWTSFRWQCRILSHDVSRSWQHRRSASWPDFRLTKKTMKTWSGAPHFHLSIWHRDPYVALSVQIYLIFRNAD